MTSKAIVKHFKDKVCRRRMKNVLLPTSMNKIIIEAIEKEVTDERVKTALSQAANLAWCISTKASQSYNAKQL